MSKEALAIGSDLRPLVLYQGHYSQGKDRFLNFINRLDLDEKILQSINEGPAKFYTTIPGNPTENPPIFDQHVLLNPNEYNEKKKNRLKVDKSARSYMLQGLLNDIYKSIDSHKTTKDMWDEISKIMQESTIGVHIKLTTCLTNYETFKARDDELLEQTYTRYCSLLNDLPKNEIQKSNLEINVEFLNNLKKEWKRFSNNIIQNKDLF